MNVPNCYLEECCSVVGVEQFISLLGQQDYIAS